MIPLPDRYWLLPRYRQVDREPVRLEREREVARLMRERPTPAAEAESLRVELERREAA